MNDSPPCPFTSRDYKASRNEQPQPTASEWWIQKGTPTHRPWAGALPQQRGGILFNTEKKSQVDGGAWSAGRGLGFPAGLGVGALLGQVRH